MAASIRSAVYSVQETLLDGIPSEAQLTSAGQILTHSEYRDVVIERTILKLCGFPLCNNPLPQSFPRKGRYRISLREHKVYDLEETRLFCSTDCVVRSQCFAASLSEDRDHDANILDLVSAFHSISVQESEWQAQIGGGQKKQETSLRIREQNEVTVPDFITSGPFNAIEGYVPQNEYRKSHRKKEREKGISSSNSQDRPGISGSSKEKSVSSQIRKHDQIDSTNEFTSEIFVDERGRISATDVKGGCRSEGNVDVENSFTSCILVDKRIIPEAVSKSTFVGEKLIPSFDSKKHQKKKNRVSWADHNNKNLVEELSSLSISGNDQTVVDGATDVEKRDSLLDQENNVENQEFYSDKVESVKILAAALAQAAEAVANGELDSDEAVARAGIKVEPADEKPPDHNKSESKYLNKADIDQFEDVYCKSCWYSAPPRGFKPELSTFGMIWNALDEWISAASIAHIYGRDSDCEGDFSFINGKEYRGQVIVGEGISAEIERALAGCISRALPALVETFQFPVPVSTLEQALGRLLRTMSLVSAIPPFSSKQWRLIAVLLLDALSVYRLPALKNRLLTNGRGFKEVLSSSKINEIEYEVFRDLVLPMGRHQELAARCGA